MVGSLLKQGVVHSILSHCAYHHKDELYLQETNL